MTDINMFHKMVDTKRAQFSSTDFPDWFYKGQTAAPCYNKKIIEMLKRIQNTFFSTEECFYGDREKSIGRYWVDFYAPTTNVIIEWYEKHHDNKNSKEYDEMRKRRLLDYIPGVKFIELREAVFLLDKETYKIDEDGVINYIKERLIG